MKRVRREETERLGLSLPDEVKWRLESGEPFRVRGRNEAARGLPGRYVAGLVVHGVEC